VIEPHHPWPHLLAHQTRIELHHPWSHLLSLTIPDPLAHSHTVPALSTAWRALSSPRRVPYVVQVEYPERKGFREHFPHWCRVPQGLDKMKATMEEEANGKLRAQVS
jgi:hypothetical protein